MSFMKNPPTKTIVPEPKPSPVVETKPLIVTETEASTAIGTKVALVPEIKDEVNVDQTSTYRIPTHETEWINLSDRFLLLNRNFDVQYAHIYAERLGLMRKLVSKAAENRWGLLL
jgi:hypothetical protein